MTAIGYAIALTLMGSEFPIEAPMVPRAQPLQEPGRYRSMRSYEDTLDFYRRVFKQTGGVRWRSIVNLPSIKAKHIASLRDKSRWEGLNIYEKDGETRIYVVPREQEEGANGVSGRSAPRTRSRSPAERARGRSTRKR